MYEKTSHQCPECGYDAQERFEDGGVFTCSGCNARFRVLVDDSTGKVGLIREDDRAIPEPLYLPKGSIRSGVALLAAFSCWWLILINWPVPSYLFSLLLTVMGYYFGFRTKMKEAESRILDATARAETPLHLPAGSIRAVLVLGFLLSGVVAYAHGRLRELLYMEFWIILAGLVLGVLLNRGLSGPTRSVFRLMFNHVKGAVVLAAGIGLFFLFVSGLYREADPVPMVLLCAVVSFYYGSRT